MQSTADSKQFSAFRYVLPLTAYAAAAAEIVAAASKSTTSEYPAEELGNQCFAKENRSKQQPHGVADADAVATRVAAKDSICIVE